MNTKFGTPDQDDLDLINKQSRRPLTADEVYTFELYLCDDKVDRDYERFSDSTLEELSKAVVGLVGVIDHKINSIARIYKSELVQETEKTYVKAWAYMMRIPKNEDFIAEIDGGIRKEVSISCAVRSVKCNICGQEMNLCTHHKGDLYYDRQCHGILVGLLDVYDWAFVSVPAQRNAQILKTTRSQ